jgi:hypothetical protein
MKTKPCFKCGQTRPITDFYRHADMADGFLGKCKTCTKADVAEYRRTHTVEVRAYDRRRGPNPDRRASVYLSRRLRRLANPDKYRARTAYRNAMRDGKLQRGPCEVCGAKKVEGHHEDWRQPLSVRWLCFLHHRQVHGQLIGF